MVSMCMHDLIMCDVRGGPQSGMDSRKSLCREGQERCAKTKRLQCEVELNGRSAPLDNAMRI